MTAMPKAPDHARPGHPDGAHPLAALGYLGALFGASALGWALIVGVGWFVWTYALVVVSYVVALAAVVLVAFLALKRGWRPKVAAAVLLVVLVAVVCWAARG